MKKILITGPLGQDGTILTKILNKDYKLFGVCRTNTDFKRLREHKEQHDIELFCLNLCDLLQVEQLLKDIKPDIIVNFAGETNVIEPWKDTNKTYEQNFLIPSNLLKNIVNLELNSFFFQSSSSLMFARSKDDVINENSAYNPMYPYGISKLSAHLLMKEYRIKYGLKCSSGVFFNHESSLRGEKFVTKKVCNFIKKINAGEDIKLNLFDLNIYRDISHAYDFMSGVKLILDNQINDDFIFSSGKLTNMLHLVKLFFDYNNIYFEKYVNYSESIIENSAIDSDYRISGDNSKLKSIGWSPKYDTIDIIKEMSN